jgi:hypothetical protein
MPPAAEPMTADSAVALIIIAVAFLTAIFYVIQKVYFWWANRRLGAAERGHTVKHYTLPPARAYVTSEPARLPEPATDPGPSVVLSAPSAGPSAVPVAVRNITVDRSRAGLIAALVAAEWNVGQIRAVLKGANDLIGQEVEAERTRQGLVPAESPRTPIAGRPYDPSLYHEAAAAER